MLAVIKSFNDGSNSSIPGLEKTTSLLFSLAGAHVDVEDIGQLNDADLIELVRKMFKQLDVDGDGLISWWEWKAVLSGRMLGRNPESRYIDPMDTLIIAIQAAHAAIEATQENKGSAEPHPMVGDSSIPFIKADEAVMQGAHPHTLSQLLDVTRPDKLDRIPVEDDIGLEFPDGFSTKKRSPRAVVKLQNMVQSLRLTNSILAQKFEQALIRADQTNNVLGADNNQFEKTVKNVSRAELHLLERRIREAEKQAEQSNRAFLSAKSRGDDLANQLQTLKNASEGARVNRERISNSKIQDQIQSEIASHQLKIREIKVERMRRAKATMKVALFLKQVAAPKLRTSRVERAKSILLLHIYAFTFRKRIKNFILRKNNAARKIQSAIRGKISREALKVQRQVAVKIQSVARRKQAGIVYAELKEEKARRDEEKAEAHRQLELLVETMWVDRQARKVQQAIRDWVKSLVKAKNKAAKKIQDSYRSCRRRAELKVKIEEQKKLRAIEEAKEREKVRIELRLRAAVRIQRAIHRR